MYTKSIPFKDFKDKPRNSTVHFNLTEREVFKLLSEFKTIFAWKDSLKGEERELETEEVLAFYNAFEEVLLAAYGVPSEDGLHFRKAGRFEFEESAVFNACMVEFVSNPQETGKLLEEIMPKGMEELVRKAEANMADVAKNTDDKDLQREIELLRSRLAEATGDKPASDTEA